RMQMNQPSRFLSEIDEDNLEILEANSLTPFANGRHKGFGTAVNDPFSSRNKRSGEKRVIGQPAGNSGAEKLSWTVGDKVKHKMWGVGTVVKISGEGDSLQLNIAFPQEGIKPLLASFAPIEKI